MKNGFTLVELLAILVLLGVIIIVAVPSVIESNRIANENEVKEFKEAVETACESYAAANNKSSGSISVRDLATAGYLKKNMKNPAGTSVSSIYTSVSITSDGCKYTG